MKRIISIGMLVLLVVLLPIKSGAVYLEGSRGSGVWQMQYDLYGLGYGGVPDGIYGEKTAAVVRSYQKASGLTADGIAGNATLTSLRRDIKSVQERLNALGYPAGDADGYYGEQTKSAVIRFQKAKGLTADGIAGSKTRAKLFGSSGIGSSLSDFQRYAKANWTSPVRADYLPIVGGRDFGADRGGRKHAGIDLYVSGGKGTPVYAMTDGTVTGVSTTFYYGTGAVTVKNSDGSVLRYGEITPAVKNGAAVKKGQIIGYIDANDLNGGTMLHLELYRGDMTGALSQANTSYRYVSGQFNRRGDLLDPGFLFGV